MSGSKHSCVCREYVLIPLDIFVKYQHNRNVIERRDAWLTLLVCDEPEKIIALIEKYPEFRQIYEEGYEICRNTERVMEMFSKELYELDRNTVQYMMDEQQERIDAQREGISAQQDKLSKQQDMIDDLYSEAVCPVSDQRDRSEEVFAGNSSPRSFALAAKSVRKCIGLNSYILQRRTDFK